MSITYSECVSVALVIQHVMRMRLTVLSSVACPALPFFIPHYLVNATILGGKIVEHKMCVLIFLYSFCLKHVSL